MNAVPSIADAKAKIDAIRAKHENEVQTSANMVDAAFTRLKSERDQRNKKYEKLSKEQHMAPLVRIKEGDRVIPELQVGQRWMGQELDTWKIGNDGKMTRTGAIQPTGPQQGVYNIFQGAFGFSSLQPVEMKDETNRPILVKPLELGKLTPQKSNAALPGWIKEIASGQMAIYAAKRMQGLSGTDPSQWTDDDRLTFLSKNSSASYPGNLAFGNENQDRQKLSREAWGTISPSAFFNHRELIKPEKFQKKMSEVLQGQFSQDYVGGNEMKFAGVIRLNNKTIEGIVKFSAGSRPDVKERKHDIFHAEGAAMKVLSDAGIETANTTVTKVENSVFLVSERFDRAPPVESGFLAGKFEGPRAIPMTSLGAMCTDDATLSKSSTEAAYQLADRGVITRQDADCVSLLDTFSSMIGDSKRDASNIAFLQDESGRWRLAPAFDINPSSVDVDRTIEGNQFVYTLPALQFNLAEVQPTQYNEHVWDQAKELAQNYWETIAESPRFSAEFKEFARDAASQFQQESLIERPKN